MIRLLVHQDAESDLEKLWEVAPKAAARIGVLLEELEGNQDLLDRLSQHDYGNYQTAKFHVSKWVEQWNKGKNLWRLKVWDLEDKGLQYRIVYAFLPIKSQYHVLGIVSREFDYDPLHEISRRIIAAYENL